MCIANRCMQCSKCKVHIVDDADTMDQHDAEIALLGWSLGHCWAWLVVFFWFVCLLSDLCCLLKCDEPGFWIYPYICFSLLFSACLPLVRTLYGWSRVYLIFPHLFIFFVLGQCDHYIHWVLLGLEQFGQFVCFWKTQHCFPLGLWLDIITSSGDDFSTFTKKKLS